MTRASDLRPRRHDAGAHEHRSANHPGSTPVRGAGSGRTINSCLGAECSCECGTQCSRECSCECGTQCSRECGTQCSGETRPECSRECGTQCSRECCPECSRKNAGELPIESRLGNIGSVVGAVSHCLHPPSAPENRGSAPSARKAPHAE